mmetsp:Transcript_25281/g.42373  ORF Transcript_25281/g.42373 Transcript_25281/m.42373 type:complete len:385 (+) Transcript_25281:268-1422(+)|eukprot:CAMPEP_0184667558 /NCGR_PEP_ID=MMETSP0308-20130426/68232_1 /TAXON_ID=38269 /ORGANISM="Gloeochaete witrockiana, Strain SAG 46.84" /LENGTH=384 /DNA_ID=CAMNT_0027112849 /DNA_START=134 /DNA_END=1288 /DNA_ORIENTATION=+
MVDLESSTAVVPVTKSLAHGANTFASHVRLAFSEKPTDYTGELPRLLTDIAMATRAIGASVRRNGIPSSMFETDPNARSYSDDASSTSPLSDLSSPPAAPGLRSVGSSASLLSTLSSRDTYVEFSAEVATRILFRSLYHDGHLCIMLSKTSEEPLMPPDNTPFGNYVLTFSALEKDPVFSYESVCGTVFSIYKRTSAAGNRGTVEDLLRKGSEQVAAGYVMYGNATVLVYSMGQGVHAFTMHPSIKEFFLHPTPLRIPSGVKSLFLHYFQEPLWDEQTRKLVESLTGEGDYEIQYSNNLLADYHHFLAIGGLAAFPKSMTFPDGPVHYLSVAAPLAFLTEQAGGSATDGSVRILDKKVKSIHETTALYLGSADVLKVVDKFLSS